MSEIWSTRLTIEWIYGYNITQDRRMAVEVGFGMSKYKYYFVDAGIPQCCLEE